jgi:PHD/YefM family antitoxin component YafN of YafNO toxin-antitoxin module
MKVSAAEIGGNFGQLAGRALVEPVSITKHGREHLVLLSAVEYARLIRRDRRVWRTSEAPSDVVEAVRTARMDQRHDHLNELLDNPDLVKAEGAP